MDKRQEMELLGWCVRLDNTNAWDTTKPFRNYEIIQPDGEVYQLFCEDGSPFYEIMSMEQAWDIIDQIGEDIET